MAASDVLLSKEFASTATLQRCAAFVMTAGPGAVGGLYAAMGGFYIEHLKNRSFFIVMLLCYCAPGPIVSLLQQQFDDLFDEEFSTPVTYVFRVMVMQLVLGFFVVAWIFCPVSSGVVLAIGSCLGFVCFAIISSSLQMVAAIAPTHIISAKLGMQVGGILPLVVFFCFGFTPTSSKEEFDNVVTTVLGFTLLAASVLGYFFHKKTNLFDKGYQRLSYDQSPRSAPTDEECSENESLLRKRQMTETTPLNSAVAEHGVQSWVRYWQACHGLAMGISFCLVSLAGFCGDADLAQTLVLLKLLMELVGRVLSCAIPSVPCFQDGPWHKVMASSVIIALGLFSVCLAKLFGTSIAHVLFMTSWCCLFVISVFVSSLLDVTTGSYVEVRDRKSVARTNQMVLLSSVLVGLLASKVMSMHLENSPATSL